MVYHNAKMSAQVQLQYAPTNVAEIRAQLSEAIRSFWATPAGQQLRMALSTNAYQSGYADAVSEIMKQVAPQLRSVARRTNIGRAYKLAWGKV
jgi:hypothetical protein